MAVLMCDLGWCVHGPAGRGTWDGTTSLPVRNFGGFGKTSISILNPAGPTSDRQQVNGSFEGQGMTAQNNAFAVFLS